MNNSSKFKTVSITVLVMLLIIGISGIGVYFGFKDKVNTTEPSIETIELNGWTNTVENLSYYENSCSNDAKEYSDKIVPEYQKLIDNKIVSFGEASPLKLKINVYENGEQTKVVNSDLFYATQTLTQPEGEPVVSKLAFVNTKTLMDKLGVKYQCAYLKFNTKYNNYVSNNTLKLSYGKDFSTYAHILDTNVPMNPPATSDEKSLFPMMCFDDFVGNSNADNNYILQEPVLEISVYYTNSVLDFMEQPDYIK